MKLLKKVDSGFITLKIEVHQNQAIAFLGSVSEEHCKRICDRLIKAWHTIKPCRNITHKELYLKSIAMNML